MSDSYKKSQAIVADGLGNFSLETIQVGMPAAGEVRVQLKAAGLCHTDWDSIKTWDAPFIVGHEGAGVIDAMGEGVTGFELGQPVVLNWAIPCGVCYQCREGRPHICEKNSPVTGDGISGHAHAEATLFNGRPIKRSFHLGTFSEYTVVKKEAVTPLNSNTMKYATAAIVGCAVMTGYGSVVNAAKLQAGSTAAIIGCGGVGLNVIQACKLAGANKIIAIDITQERLDQALDFGATHTVLSDKDDSDFIGMRDKVGDLTDGGADYAFECTAIPALGAAPLAVVRNAGTAIQVSGIEQKIDFDCELFEWDKIYMNPLYGKCRPHQDFAVIQDLHAQKRLKLDELISHTYSLEQLAKGFDDMLSGKLAKGVIIMGSASNE